MLKATVTPDPSYALKLKTNHLKSHKLEARLIKAITDWCHFQWFIGSSGAKVQNRNKVSKS